MAALVPIKIYQGQPGTTSTLLHTVSSGKKTIVKNVLMCNTTSSSATVSLYFGAASAANQILNAYTVKANDTVLIELSAVLDAADVIRGLQGTNAAVTIHISGVEVTL
jgi:hypothetical protein